MSQHFDQSYLLSDPGIPQYNMMLMMFEWMFPNVGNLYSIQIHSYYNYHHSLVRGPTCQGVLGLVLSSTQLLMQNSHSLLRSSLYFIQNTSKHPGRQNLGWHPAAVFSWALCADLHHQHFTPWLSEVTGSCNFFCVFCTFAFFFGTTYFM